MDRTPPPKRARASIRLHAIHQISPPDNLSGPRASAAARRGTATVVQPARPHSRSSPSWAGAAVPSGGRSSPLGVDIVRLRVAQQPTAGVRSSPPGTHSSPMGVAAVPLGVAVVIVPLGVAAVAPLFWLSQQSLPPRGQSRPPGRSQ